MRLVTWITTQSPMEDPGISPNQSGLPGLEGVLSVVGALTWGLVAIVAGLVVSVIVWALAHQQGNYAYASSGRSIDDATPGVTRGSGWARLDLDAA